MVLSKGQNSSKISSKGHLDKHQAEGRHSPWGLRVTFGVCSSQEEVKRGKRIAVDPHPHPIRRAVVALRGLSRKKMEQKKELLWDCTACLVEGAKLSLSYMAPPS